VSERLKDTIFGSMLLYGVRDLLASLGDGLVLPGELAEKFSDVLLGVGLGGPRRSPGSLRSVARLVGELHTIKSDARGAARSVFLTLGDLLRLHVDLHGIDGSDGVATGGRVNLAPLRRRILRRFGLLLDWYFARTTTSCKLCDKVRFVCKNVEVR
jgi:hypothetical protein